jgi:hypothetical protein
MDCLAGAARRSGKPAVAVLYSRAVDPDDLVFEEVLRRLRVRLSKSGIPVYPSMVRALRAIGLANGRGDRPSSV